MTLPFMSWFMYGEGDLQSDAMVITAGRDLDLEVYSESLLTAEWALISLHGFTEVQ